VVPSQPHGSKPALFCVHPAGGNVLGLADLSRYLGRDYPVYGLQARGVIEGQEPQSCLRTMASFYIDAIREVQLQAPCYLGGVSFGGIVAYEMAVQLRAAGQQVAMVFIGDTWLLQGPHYRLLRYALHVPLLVYAIGYRETIRLLMRRLSRRRNGPVFMKPEPYANELHRHKMEAHSRALQEYTLGAQRHFAAAEALQLRALPQEHQIAAFFRCWVRKEAYLKASGRGLGTGLDRFEVPVAFGEVPGKVRGMELGPREAEWWVQDNPVSHDYAAALVHEGTLREVRYWIYEGGWTG
jgi:hypothetical protein